jgi:hypothetical protein
VQHHVYDSLPATARLSGSPTQMVQRLREVAGCFDVTDIVNVTQFRGYLAHEQVLGSIRLIAERVMPAFRSVAAF